MIVTGSSDSSVKVWKFTEGTEKGAFQCYAIIILSEPCIDNIVELQTILLKGKLPLASALTFLPQTTGNLNIFFCQTSMFLHTT